MTEPDAIIYLHPATEFTPGRVPERTGDTPEEIARWVYAAAVKGFPDAQVSWGQMLLDGYAGEYDPAAALRWFTIAANAGYLDGINMVGRCHELGLGTERNGALAVESFRKAADQGHAWAQFNLATLMLKGDGIAQDIWGAVALLVHSARQKNAKAMNMLGRAREEGWIGPVRLDSAKRWYCRAAEGGCYRGRFHLARFLETDGKREEALRWYRASLEIAPPDFCEDAAKVFSARTEPEFLALIEIARTKALRAV